MGSEFIVFSMLNGKSPDLTAYSQYNDRNRWYFGTQLDELNLGTLRKFNCIPRTGIFSAVSLDSNQNTVLTVYWGNNQWQANHKVYNTLRTNLNSYKFIESYELMGQVIHVLDDNSGQFAFMLTFTKGPAVEVQVAHGAPSTGILMNIKYTNGGQRYQIQKKVDVVKVNTNITIKNIKKINGKPSGVINLEEYSSFSGPIYDAYLGNGSRGADLIGRVKGGSNYFPGPIGLGTFSHVETFGTTTIGVHTTEGNNSFFTMFYNIDQFNGTNTPAHGVNAFHFAPFNNSDNGTVLIAYSTAEPAYNSLQLLALKGSDRIGVGSSKDGLIENFTMVRVIPLGKGDIFYVFGYNSDQTQIHVFRVEYSNGQIKCDEIDYHEDAHDFTISVPDASNLIYIFYISNSDRTQLNAWSYNRMTGEKVGQVLKSNIKDLIGSLKGDLEPYEMLSLSSYNHNSTHFYIIVNCQGTKFYEFVYNSVSIGAPLTFTYYKIQGLLGRYISGSKEHFAVMVNDVRFQHETRYVFYRRQVHGGGQFAYWTVRNDQPRPFTLTTCNHNKTHFQMATYLETMPLTFQVVGPLGLNITDNSALDTILIEIEGAPGSSHQDFKVSDIIDGNTDPEGSSSWWPYVLLITVLVLCAVGFIVWKSIKDKKVEADDPENYVSLKPEARESNKPASDA